MSEIPDTVGIIVDQVTEMACAQCNEQMDVSGMDPFSKVECPHCSAINTVCARLGNFLLKRLLGKGGMGGVYYARDEALGRDVAIKVMLPEVGRDEDCVDTVKREAQAAAKLNHPHIAQIYAFGLEKDQPYIVMELVPGKGLDKLMEGGPVDQSLAMQIAYDIAEGLGQADEIGLLHGDIKPENILLDDKQSAKLVDFGIAAVSGQQQDGIWGTPYYIAPEKVRRQPIDARSDIYSLGATLYHALTGIPPFDGETPVEVVKARLDKNPKPLTSLRKNVDPLVDQIIQRMLQREPARRYPNYASLISDLRKAKEKLPKPRLGGKKIVVTGKRRAAQSKNSTGNVVSTGPVIKAPSASRKIKISAGATSTVPQSGLTGAQKPAESSDALAEYKKKLVSSGPSEAELARRAASRKRGRNIFVFLLLAAGLAGGGFFVMQQREQALQRRLEAFEVIDTQAGTVDIMKTLETAVSRYTRSVENATAMKHGATNAVYIITGARMEISQPKIKAEPEKEALPAEKEEEVAAVVQAPVPEPPAPTVERPDGLPEGMPTREELDALRRRQAQAAAGEVEEETPAPASPAPAAAPAVAANEKLPEAPVIERQWAEKVIAAVLLAEAELPVAQDAIINACEAAARIEDNFSIDVVRPAKEKLDIARATITESIAKGEAALGEIREIYERLDERRAAAERRIAERIKAEEEAARRRQEAEERQREEEARRRQLEGELATVEALKTRIRIDARNNDFAAVVKTLKAEAERLETDQAKNAIQILVDRYERLVWMRAFLVRQLSENPMQWGIGSGASAMDVTGANDQFITHRGGRLAWSDVSIPQMLRFVDHYRESRNIRVREQGDLNFAGAIFCYEFADGNESALNRARDYANRAVRAVSHLDQDVRRLVPVY